MSRANFLAMKTTVRYFMRNQHKTTSRAKNKGCRKLREYQLKWKQMPVEIAHLRPLRANGLSGNKKMRNLKHTSLFRLQFIKLAI